MTKAATPKVESKAVTITVMGREFRVAAPGGEERQLLASVDLLNQKMKEIRDTGKVVGNERIAIMAALNIAHEHLHAEHSGNEKSANHAAASNMTIDEAYIRGKINTFESMIEKAVSEQEKLF